MQWHFIPRIRDAKSDHQKLWFWATMAYSTTEVEEDLVILWSIWVTNTQWMPPLLRALLQLHIYDIHTRLANHLMEACDSEITLPGMWTQFAGHLANIRQPFEEISWVQNYLMSAYFASLFHWCREQVLYPMVLLGCVGQYDVRATAKGGGLTGTYVHKKITFFV